MQIKLLVATHKEYRMPQDDMYFPVHVGKAISNVCLDKYTPDDSGDNISSKNKNYCELTCLYWAWKNLEADYIGLCHYRRHFAQNNNKDKWQRILDKPTAEKMLEKYPAILPKQRNYYIETTYQQYVHAHNKQDLDITEDILRQYYPEYMPAYKMVMDSTKGHRFNMMVMRRDLFDGYCNWLFDVLFRLEDRLDISEYSAYDRRVFGFVSERLLDVWLLTNKVDYCELPVVNMENQNWPKKIINFLKRKFLHVKTA